VYKSIIVCSIIMIVILGFSSMKTSFVMKASQNAPFTSAVATNRDSIAATVHKVTSVILDTADGFVTNLSVPSGAKSSFHFCDVPR
jgi:hypothetical protein